MLIPGKPRYKMTWGLKPMSFQRCPQCPMVGCEISAEMRFKILHKNRQRRDKWGDKWERSGREVAWTSESTGKRRSRNLTSPVRMVCLHWEHHVCFEMLLDVDMLSKNYGWHLIHDDLVSCTLILLKSHLL